MSLFLAMNYFAKTLKIEEKINKNQIRKSNMSDNSFNRGKNHSLAMKYRVGQKKCAQISNLHISRTVISINAILSISYL